MQKMEIKRYSHTEPQSPQGFQTLNRFPSASPVPLCEIFFLFWSLGHLIFEHCFGFRYSSRDPAGFGFSQLNNSQSCPLGLDQIQALWTRIFTEPCLKPVKKFECEPQNIQHRIRSSALKTSRQPFRDSTFLVRY